MIEPKWAGWAGHVVRIGQGDKPSNCSKKTCMKKESNSSHLGVIWKIRSSSTGFRKRRALAWPVCLLLVSQVGLCSTELVKLYLKHSVCVCGPVCTELLCATWQVEHGRSRKSCYHSNSSEALWCGRASQVCDMTTPRVPICLVFVLCCLYVAIVTGSVTTSIL